MSKSQLPDELQGLARLLALRQDEVQQLEIGMAQQEALRQRYQRNMARMAALCAGSGSSGALAPALVANCGNYKQNVLSMMAQHQQELTLHEADMAANRARLLQLSRKCEALAHNYRQRHSAWQQELARGEQKRQDDLATQVWLRRQA
ncbi:flagellar FliJ family protein [Vogesella facilis]|uniref:Flagellar FliJ protein n=1 Tax=Vogesella facilis TaxID=1655232 RepID=A0ABV7RGL0_9NEIS